MMAESNRQTATIYSEIISPAPAAALSGVHIGHVLRKRMAYVLVVDGEFKELSAVRAEACLGCNMR